MSGTTLKNLKLNMCKWPIGDPRDDDFHFCGGPSGGEQSYCDHHMGVAHTETRGRSPARPQKPA